MEREPNSYIKLTNKKIYDLSEEFNSLNQYHFTKKEIKENCLNKVTKDILFKEIE